jgi:hypothetical protein
MTAYLAEPRWKYIRKDKPRVMAFVMSVGSVSQHARFLLMFLYSLQEVIPTATVRLLFPLPSAKSLTTFKQQSLEDAIDSVMHRHGIGKYGLWSGTGRSGRTLFVGKLIAALP